MIASIALGILFALGAVLQVIRGDRLRARNYLVAGTALALGGLLGALQTYLWH